jgi:hypothetical protein
MLRSDVEARFTTGPCSTEDSCRRNHGPQRSFLDAPVLVSPQRTKAKSLPNPKNLMGALHHQFEQLQIARRLALLGSQAQKPATSPLL